MLASGHFAFAQNALPVSSGARRRKRRGCISQARPLYPVLLSRATCDISSYMHAGATRWCRASGSESASGALLTVWLRAEPQSAIWLSVPDEFVNALVAPQFFGRGVRDEGSVGC